MGQDSLSYSVVNPGGGSDSGKLSITIIPNPPKIIRTDGYSRPIVSDNGAIIDVFVVSTIQAGTIIDLSPYVYQNCFDNSSVITTISSPISLDGKKGHASTVALHPLQVHYSVAANASGTDTFTLRFKNTVPSIIGYDGLVGESLTVTVIIQGTAPTATAYNTTCKKNVTGATVSTRNVAIPMTSLMNNKDYRVFIITMPTHGSLSYDVIAGVENLVYIPNYGFTGTDTITFVVRDLTNQVSSSSTITIVVS